MGESSVPQTTGKAGTIVGSRDWEKCFIASMFPTASSEKQN